jgi:hypothetical protein
MLVGYVKMRSGYMCPQVPYYKCSVVSTSLTARVGTLGSSWPRLSCCFFFARRVRREYVTVVDQDWEQQKDDSRNALPKRGLRVHCSSWLVNPRDAFVKDSTPIRTLMLGSQSPPSAQMLPGVRNYLLPSFVCVTDPPKRGTPGCSHWWLRLAVEVVR